MITKILIWIFLMLDKNVSRSGFNIIQQEIIEKIIKPTVSSLIFSSIYSIHIQEYKHRVIVWINTSKIKSIPADLIVRIEEYCIKNIPTKKEVIVIVDDFRIKSPLQNTYSLYNNYLETIKKFQ